MGFGFVLVGILAKDAAIENVLYTYTDDSENERADTALELVPKESNGSTVASFHPSDRNRSPTNEPVSSLAMRKSGAYKPLTFSPVRILLSLFIQYFFFY